MVSDLNDPLKEIKEGMYKAINDYWETKTRNLLLIFISIIFTMFCVFGGVIYIALSQVNNRQAMIIPNECSNKKEITTYYGFSQMAVLEHVEHSGSIVCELITVTDAHERERSPEIAKSRNEVFNKAHPSH